MIEEEAWIAKYLPGFGNPRELYASEFSDAVAALVKMMKLETDSMQKIDRDHRSIVENYSRKRQ
jgi:hypothetical protein